MADIVIATDLPNPETGVQLKEKYRDMGDGTHARVVSNAAGGSVDVADLAALGVYPAITSPLDISGATLCLLASDLVLANDDPVATWPDTSASGFDATQATANKQPVKQTTADGYAVVRFDDSANPQRLSLTGAGLSLFRNLDAYSIMAVFSPQLRRTLPTPGVGAIVSAAGVDGTIQIVDFDWDRASADYQFQTSNDNTVDRANYIVGQTGGSVSGPLAQTALVAVIGICDFIHARIIGESNDFPYMAGVTWNQAPLGPTTDAASFAITVGGWLDGGDEHGTTGDIAAVIVWPRVLTAFECRQLLEFASTEWGTL